MNGSTPPVPSDGPIPAELLADLQAGLLDDATAARVRRRIRTDPQAGPGAKSTLAALDQVRRDLAHLGQDAPSAPPVPAEVSARLSEMLRAQPPAPTPATGRWKVPAAVAGTAAAAVAAIVGGTVLSNSSGSAPSTLTSLGQITVSPPRSGVGLSGPQILDLLSAPPDLGPLTDLRRRTACLSALGYPSDVRILGARPLDVAGRHGVLVLLPPDAAHAPDTVVGLVVAADCDAGHAEPLAHTVINRPAKRP